MGKKRASQSQPQPTLRQRAEAILRATRKKLARIPKEKIAKIVHELEVHQVELQMQNEELRESQAHLAESRDRFNALYDFAPVGYFTLDKTGAILQANLTLATMLGVDRQKLVGGKFTRFVTRDGQDTLYLHLRDVFAGEERQTCELPLRAAHGAEICVRMESIAMPDPGSHGLHCWSALSDITARKQAEDALARSHAELEQRVAERTRSLRESHERLRRVVSNESVGVVFWDPTSGAMFDANDTFLRLTGWTREEVMSRELTWRKLTPGEYLEASLAEIRKFQETGRIGPYEKEYFRKDGTRQWFIFAGSSLGNNTCVEFCVDISARKRVEATLSEREERLRAILNTVADAVIIIDQRGTVVETNPATQRMFGYSETEIIGHNVKMLIPSPHREEHGGYIENCPSTGKANIMGIGPEAHARRKDGTFFPIELAISEVVNMQRFAGVIRDISARRELERAVSEVSEREQNRIGQDLHDGLCQHLAGIEFRLFALSQDLQGTAAELVPQVKELAKSVAQAIGQTRDLAHGLSPLVLKPDGLMDALRGLAAIITDSSSATCSFNCPSPVLIKDNLVAAHLYRIAQEAVQNALRHGRAKFIAINLFAQNDRAVLAIKDDGAGFPKQPLKRSGMGLRIMQYRSNLIGGSLLVEHGAKGGTTVICSLRADQAGAKSSVATVAAGSSAPEPTGVGTARRPRPGGRLRRGRG